MHGKGRVERERGREVCQFTPIRPRLGSLARASDTLGLGGRQTREPGCQDILSRHRKPLTPMKFLGRLKASLPGREWVILAWRRTQQKCDSFYRSSP